jgi:hypothetical protein
MALVIEGHNCRNYRGRCRVARVPHKIIARRPGMPGRLFYLKHKAILSNPAAGGQEAISICILIESGGKVSGLWHRYNPKSKRLPGYA